MTRTDMTVRQSPDSEDRHGSRNVGCFILWFPIQLRLSGFPSFSYLSFCADSKDQAVTRLYCQCMSGLVEHKWPAVVHWLLHGAVCIGIQWYVLVYSAMNWYTVVCIGVQWYVSVYNGHCEMYKRNYAGKCMNVSALIKLHQFQENIDVGRAVLACRQWHNRYWHMCKADVLLL
jgi:hypothetical protein